MSTLEYLLEKYPDKNWDYRALSSNPTISLKYIKNNLYDNRNVNLNKKWNWWYIAQRITYEEFINNPELPWNYFELYKILNIPFDYIKNNLDVNLNVNTNVNLNVNTNVNININLDEIWVWRNISKRVTYKEFIDNPDLPWEYECLSNNENITLEYIKNDLDKKWYWLYISKRVTYEDFINNQELPWIYGWLSQNSNIPISYIKNNPDKDWCWYFISKRVTYEDFINNQELPWNNEGLSENNDIPIEYIKNNLDEYWGWYWISSRVTYEELINNPELPWSYLWLSSNTNIPIEYIKNNLYVNRNVNFYKDWNWYAISKRVIYKEFIDNPDLPWDYSGLSNNKFDYESRILAKNIMNVIINDEKYIAKVYNPNRMRSVKSLCELEELKSEFGWTDEEFNKYVK